MTVEIFANCVFFLKVNRLSVQDKKKIKSRIQENGGVISFVLNQKCSHVIVDNIDALSCNQLKTIQKYQIPVLYDDFIWNCVEESRLLQVDDYTAKKSVEIDLEKGTESQDQEKSQYFEKPKERNEKDTENNRIYTKDNLHPDDLQDVEVAKYAVLEKILTDFKEVAVVELQRLPEHYAFPFRISANFGLLDGSQKERQFLQLKTSEEACESYDVYLEDLKKKDFMLKEDVPQEAIRFASETLQELLLEEARNTSSLSPEIHNFVELIWVEALGHLDRILLQPVNSISLNDVSKGEGILLQVRKALDDGASAEVLKQMMSEFYRIIPHKTGIYYNVDKRLLSSKQDLCQLIRDMVNVCETSMSSPSPPSLAKYRALRCKIDCVDPDSDEFLHVEHQVLQNNPSDCPVKVVQVYRVGRINETAAFQSKYGNIRSLFHSSSVCNFVGILSRGLLLPKIVVEDHGLERTDIGNLGSGIYFGDSNSTCIKYSKPSETDGSRLLVVCNVALGKCLELYKRDFSLTSAPAGYQSVHGVQKTSGVLSDFEDDEFVVYNTAQVKIRYIVKFYMEEDNVKEFHPDTSITEVAERVPCMSNLQSEEISLDKNSLHKIKSGLLDTSGNSIPLKDIHIKGRIMDLIAQVVVFQTYTNLSRIPIEAKYIFPLDGTAAVCGFEAFINGKHIIGEVKEKDQAHQEYRQAVHKGHGAYLMDQDAPDVFTVSVGNLPPEATVLIKITYITELSMQWGSICFHMLAAVAPWQQDKALKENTQDTVEKVYIKAEDAQKGVFSLDMSVEMPYKIENISSLTHRIKIKKTDCKAVISTYEDSSLDSDGFDLQISMCEAYLPRMWVEKHPEHESEACMLVFQPNFDTTDNVEGSSEIVICLDCSSSMEDLVFQQAKQIALLVLRSLSDDHRINLIRFGTNYQELFSYPKCTTDEALLEEFIKVSRPVMGNTDLWKPLRSLSLLVPSHGLRNILLISDGHIQNESLTFQIIKKNAKHTRLFACGVGPTANRHMLRSLAQYGAGAFEFFEAKSKYNWKDKVAAQILRMESPGCNSISVKWQQFNINAPEPMQAPAQIQSLFHTERLLVYGFIPHCTQATLNAFINDQELSTMVSTTKLQKTTGTLLHKLTARAIIKDYEDGILHENEAEHEMKKQELKSLIIELSKKYSIVTQFTSFVAIEERGYEITPQPDIPNIKELISKEGVDLLPYIDWEMNADEETQGLIKYDSFFSCMGGDLLLEDDEESIESDAWDMQVESASCLAASPDDDLLGVDVVAESDKMPEIPEGSFFPEKKLLKNEHLPSEYQVSKSDHFDKEPHLSAPPLPEHHLSPGPFLQRNRKALKTTAISAHKEASTIDQEEFQVSIKKFGKRKPLDLAVTESYSFMPESTTHAKFSEPLITNAPTPSKKELQAATSSKSAFQFGMASDRISSQSVPSLFDMPSMQSKGQLFTMAASPHENFLFLDTVKKSDSFSGSSSTDSSVDAVYCGMQAPVSTCMGGLSTFGESQPFSVVQSQLFHQPLKRPIPSPMLGITDKPSSYMNTEFVGASTGFSFSKPLFGAKKAVVSPEPCRSILSVRRGVPIPETKSHSVQFISFVQMDQGWQAPTQEAGKKLMDPKSVLSPKTYKMNFVPSGTSLLALQTQAGFWHLNPELGNLLTVDVDYLCNVFLAQKGIHSLGPRGKEEVLQLIATLLVLQLLRFTQELQLITFKSLMKLDDSSTESTFHSNLQKAVAWARKTDRQYPTICSRLELGKDWDSFTRQLLRIDPIEINSPFLKANQL